MAAGSSERRTLKGLALQRTGRGRRTRLDIRSLVRNERDRYILGYRGNLKRDCNLGRLTIFDDDVIPIEGFKSRTLNAQSVIAWRESGWKFSDALFVG